MKTWLVVIAVAAFASGPAFADPVGDTLQSKAQNCIQSAAPEAAAQASGLQDAVGFLLELCAVAVSHVEAYDASSRTLADWQGRSSSAQLVGVSIDPMTGELKTPPGFKMDLDPGDRMLNDLHRATPRTEMIAIAARAVLAAKRPAVR